MTVSYDVNKNCNLAKIVQDLGEQWNEQGVAEWANRVSVSLTDAMAAAMKGMDDIGERLGVAQQTVSDMDTENCNLAKIGKDLGEHWNEQGVPIGQKKLL